MAENPESICYNKHFLSKVICRVDFGNPLPEELFSTLSLGEDIAQSFPIRGKDQIENASNINVIKKQGESPVVSEEITTFVRKEFVDSTGKNRCYMSRKYIILDYNNYDGFEALHADFMKLIDRIKIYNVDILMERFGLRYINTFNSDTFKIQKGYFSSEVNSFIGATNVDGMLLSRAMGHTEFINDDIRLNANFGKYNRNYPGILQKNDFVLDYDAFVQGTYKISEAFPQKLLKAHEMVQNIFESHITEKLRAVMNG